MQYALRDSSNTVSYIQDAGPYEDLLCRSVMSNGDTTGFSLHADFQNGWDMKVLKDVVIGKCQNPSVTEPVE